MQAIPTNAPQNDRYVRWATENDLVDRIWEARRSMGNGWLCVGYPETGLIAIVASIASRSSLKTFGTSTKGS